ncbi:MAG: hypothetical protein AB1689_08655 [Thermodesulfobacteriota bacterium]
MSLGNRLVLCSVALAVIAAVDGARTAVAQVPSGSTLSPDLQSYLVNKDLGAERWTINLNLYSQDPDDVINVTGNIFRSDGGPASFVECLVREDSTGTLTDPASTFRLSCSGSDACASTAETCARESWTLISDDVPVPASFFLPPGGVGTLPPPDGAARAALARAGWTPPRAPAVHASVLERMAAYAREALDDFRRWVAARRDLDFAFVRPRAAFAQAGGDRGATLTPDRLNFLVTKDVGDERWSISFSYAPTLSEQGLVVNQVLSVTGNVYQPDGSPPSFVYCLINDGSGGTLEDPSSEFSFTCSGTDACETTAAECAANAWNQISSDIPLQASFFLPPQGLPATPQSDPEILVIGRTSDPPSIVVGDFETAQSTAADRPAGACPEGAACTVAMLGSCADVEGVVVDVDGFGCGCEIEEPSPECIGCGGGASGQCGAACEYQAGDATARGTCLPFDYESEECACYAVGAGEQQSVQGCGGVLQAVCPDGGCCANDPRGACAELGGLVECPGVCTVGDDPCFTGD